MAALRDSGSVSLRYVRPLPVPELELLPAARLNAYRRELLRLPGSAADYDLTVDERAHLDPGLIYFKDDPAWRQLYETVTVFSRTVTTTADRDDHRSTLAWPYGR